MKLLYIFVEGNDDAMFFSNVIRPLLSEKYEEVEIIKYAQMKKIKVDNFLKSIRTLKFDYILAADIDLQPSVGAKIRIIEDRFSEIDRKKVVIVIKEIESWFLAGLNESTTARFNLPPIYNTEEIFKEDFNQLYRKKFRSRIDFMREILKQYSIEIAMSKNRSFDFFIRNFVE